MRSRKPPLTLSNDRTGTGMQIAGPGVIPQASPEFEHCLERCCRQIRYRRKTLQKSGVIGNDGLHLRLLQHNFRQPYPVGICRVLPGQVVPTVLFLPANEGGRKFFEAGGSGHEVMP